jgi:NADH dehydrogenase (ubiquinone) 1 beta subcomplex subunit 10
MGRKKGLEFDESPPDDFDPSNPYKDPVAMLEMREHLVREKWIDIEKAKILREKLKWCYRIEGINHLQKCRHLVQQYLDSTRGIGWGKDGRHPSLHGLSLSLSIYIYIVQFLFRIKLFGFHIIKQIN